MNNEETAEEQLRMIANTSDLSTAIKRLERRRMLQEVELRDQMHTILESLKPANILKHTLHEVRESTSLKHNLFKVALGLGAGYFSRTLIVGKSAGLIKKVFGTALQYGITNFVAKKDDDKNDYSSKKKNLLQRFFSK